MKLRTHIPLMRTLLILILGLLCMGLVLSAFQQRDGSVIPLQVDNWQWAPSYSFEENASPIEGWKDYTEGEIIPAKSYWLRIPLPSGDWDDPHFQIMQVGSIKIYDGTQIIYEYILSERNKRIKNGFYWKMAPLTLPLPAYVDVLVRYGDYYPVSIYLEFGNKASLLSRILRHDLDNLILGALLIFSAFIALGLYLSQRSRLYLYFALLAFSGGYATIVCNYLLQIIWDNPLLGHFQDACMPLGTFAFIGALGHVFPNVYRRMNRLLWWLMLIYTLLTILASVISIDWYVYALIGFAPLFVIVFISVYWTIWSAYRLYKDFESIWIMAGFTALTTTATIHMYRVAIYTYMPEWINNLLAWTRDLPIDLIFWGLFVFVVCLIRVIMYRYTALNRQLAEFNRSLKHVVQTRTKQLQERTEQLERTHERLGSSMRENAEALAEAMILEERHRITGSIHDTVGHTLTATIIQLEAAKRLLPTNPSLAKEKLETSQSLVRRGLEDIRQSVRLLREDASYYDLPGSIGALIRETEHTAGCKVEYHLDHLTADLSTLQKRIIFQSLQEGLSIGIRNGQHSPSHFYYVALADADSIHTQLVHLDENGYTSRDIGFGLHAIAEQAARIGGKIKVGAEEVGFVITLTLPLTKADHWVI